jgi:hypothetical protein
MENYKTYLFSYNHNGESWITEIKAKNPKDAKARLAKLAYAEYSGEKVIELPATPGIIWRLLVSFRNFFLARPPA